VGGPRLPIKNPRWQTATILNHRQCIDASLDYGKPHAKINRKIKKAPTVALILTLNI